MATVQDPHKTIRGVAYLCHGIGLLGIVFWVINGLVFFYQFASRGFKEPTPRELVINYGGALITAIIPIILIYALGSVLYILLEIAENTHKPQL